MDEISDAELDSMLQEMDIDDVSEADVVPKFNVSINHNSPPQPQSTAIITKEAENVVAFTPTKSTTKNVESDLQCDVNVASSTSVAGNNGAEVAEGCVSSDCLNADSFSQASTVEFSELRAHSAAAAHVDTNMMPSSNSVASSYTGSECSLEGGVIGGERISDEEVTTNTVDYLVKNSAENTDDESGSTDEGAYSEGAAQRPQRPTSLNLPTIQSNLYENAGQTPPGTQTMQNTTMHMENTNSNAPNASGTNSTPIGSPEEEIGAINEVAEATGYSDPYANLGKVPPIWVPDNMATGCMQCHAKFTMIKRRHHCRACGKVLCSVCCSQKFKLEFLSSTAESRVCLQCFLILNQRQQGGGAIGSEVNAGVDNDVASAAAANTNVTADQTEGQVRSPNPNNPMEYCSTIPPYRQVNTQNIQPPSVIVPVGVLKKEGSSYSSNSSNGGGDGAKKTRKRKSVMFSDGIAPGSDLASMEHQWTEAKHARRGAHQQSDKSRGSSGAVNKPPTPVRTQPSASSSNSDATTMGLVASLFRGSIPPMAAAATMAAVQDDDKGENETKYEI